MKSLVFICQVLLIVITGVHSVPPECQNSSSNRPPEDTDIQVTCGTEYMDLSILLCPLYFANYNESMLTLNNQSSTKCNGIADFGVQPPVIRYKFTISEESFLACGNKVQIKDHLGTGAFSDFSSIQYVTISGMVVTFDPTPGLITYRPMVTYLFSCSYPLQYVLNNSQLAVGGAEVSVNSNNGSFISTLSFKLYANKFYNESLIIPKTGLNLKTNIYAEISATSLTDRFNVLLWWCIATVEPYTDAVVGYNLFVGCDMEPYTDLEENGVSEKARFKFQAFRFVEHQDKEVSTFYLHCFTGLCQKNECARKLPNCTGTGTGTDGGAGAPNRRRREATDSYSTTITSPAIIVGSQTDDVPLTSPSEVSQAEGPYSRPLVGVIVCVAVLAFLVVGMGVFLTWTTRHKIPL